MKNKEAWAPHDYGPLHGLHKSQLVEAEEECRVIHK